MVLGSFQGREFTYPTVQCSGSSVVWSVFHSSLAHQSTVFSLDFPVSPCPKHNHQSNLEVWTKVTDWWSVLENSKCCSIKNNLDMRKQHTFLEFFLLFQFFFDKLSVFVGVHWCWKTFLTWHQAIEGWQLLGREWKHVIRDAAGGRVFFNLGCLLERWIFNIRNFSKLVHIPPSSPQTHNNSQQTPWTPNTV